MRYTHTLVPTLKQAPVDASSVGHVLLARAGYIRRVGAGIYSFLPLGLRVLAGIERIVREQMDAAGALEVRLPGLLPAEYFRESGRWSSFGDELLRLKDRRGSDYHLAPTHEEVITDLARHELKSYRDLPKTFYQIQTKYRDEPRPRAGLLRCREFSMKDAYSFDADESAALASYDGMRKAYHRIFDRLGLDYRMVAASSGAMGGSISAEFQALVQTGEDELAACDRCDYAANLEVASAGERSGGGSTVIITGASIGTGSSALPALRKVSTPGKRTIEEVSALLDAPASAFLKSLVYVAGERVVLAVVRGDHVLNEVKLARALGVDAVRMADAEVVTRATGAAVGFAGPVGYQGEVVVDRAAAEVLAAVTGANQDDHHLLNVVRGRDYDAPIADLRNVMHGDACPACGGTLELYRGIEIGHIFVLGTHYSAKMGAMFVDQNGERRPLFMGCYGVGVSRLVATVVEQHHDERGIVWPASIAPYAVHVVQLGEEPEVVHAAGRLEQELAARGIDALIDDRDERAGVKLNDADLIGLPLRVTVGAKSVKAGSLELKPRSENNPKKLELLPIETAASTLAERVRALS